MSDFKLADRLSTLPPYLFAAIDKAKAEVAAQGMDIISLGIGDPDLPTPNFIIEALHEAAKKPVNHQYPSYVGMLGFRQAVADWYKERFNVDLDAEKEVVSLIGSKEGIAHFPLAYINPGDIALIATPNYPVYGIATSFAGGQAEYLPLLEENDFLIDLDAVSDDMWAKAKMIFVCYPNNPTAATATKEFYERLIEKAREFNVIVVSDAAYTEIYYDSENKPLSIFECEGAKDVCIEFHSLSKTYNMTGWRVGMAVGNSDLIAGLGKIKENVDSGIFQAVQEAGIAALKQGEPYAEQFRAIYKERRDVVSAALTKIGIKHRVPDAAFYMWCHTPEGYTSSEFVTNVLKQTGVVLTPGQGFGAPGEGYFRISLTVNNDLLEEAVSRISKL
ncbi:LL-diaminopimelate aminotransferase [Pseudodesulfovibrio piezophilus]|uniref:Aminotransferase n=1 Tax=Pseudodesulfovibrio piezophilus (strain DSM 21447 / JCM 15486 / C1TLV30) TaxID=1322246 RepID=M1WP12_PSEP2|nr:LL-diaminopimelate aminotransferase [Pseudodesulfovibrio piezophilus]CCH47939.1 LL-diaminopimelate aminotransferase [Pseudodesulfovibrio piezophilus C1TLV30]